MKNILKHKLFKLGTISFLVLGLLAASLPALNNAQADDPTEGVVITKVDTTASLDISAAGGAGETVSLWSGTELLVIQENEAGDISSGEHTLSLPEGWQFSTSTANIEATLVDDSDGLIELEALSLPLGTGATTLTFEVKEMSTNPSVLTFSGISIQPTGEKPSVGHITYSGEEGVTIIKGVDENTDFGTLTTIPGAVAKLAIEEQPKASVVYGTGIGITVKTQDQFGNNSTNNLGTEEAVTLSLNEGSGSFLSGPTVANIETDGSLTFSDLIIKPIGTYTLNATSTNLIGVDSDAIEITAKSLTVKDAEVLDKVYDGTTEATITHNELEGVVDGDNVNLSSPATGTFDNKNVGDSKAVTASLALGGSDAGNYTLTQPTGLKGKITSRPINVTFKGGITKVYDGSEDIESGKVMLGDEEIDDLMSLVEVEVLNDDRGLLDGDELSIDSLSLADALVDVNKEISTVVVIVDNESKVVTSNYALEYINNSGEITPAPLTVINATVATKEYDGNNVATIQGAELSGVIAEDKDKVYLMDGATGTFASKDVGTGIGVTISLGITGAKSSNYSLTTQPNLSGDITEKELTVKNAGVPDKVYDGTTGATITHNGLEGVVDKDNVNLSSPATGTFDNKNVGDSKSVTTSLKLEGDDARNYTLTQPTGLTGKITKRELTIGGSFTVKDKYYDKSAVAEIATNNLGLVGVVGGEDVSLTNVKAGFANDKVENNKSVTIISADLAGAGSGNYSLSLSEAPTTQASIKAVPSGGGAGLAIPNACSAVVYGDWGACSASGYQFREVISRSPESCSLTVEQQLATSRLCTPDNGQVEEEDESVEAGESETPIQIGIERGQIMKIEKELVITPNPVLTNNLSGRILLQVEEKGQAWYLEPVTKEKIFMGRPDDAFSLMRQFGLGISETNFTNFEANGTPSQFAGRIFLRVESSGEAYYINPVDLKMHYLGRPADAFRIMRDLALGITNYNLRQIPVANY